MSYYYDRLTDEQKAESAARYRADLAEQERIAAERKVRNIALTEGIAAALAGCHIQRSDENAGSYEKIMLPVTAQTRAGAGVILSFAADRIEVHGVWPADPDDERAKEHPEYARRIYPRDIGATPYDAPYEPRISVSAEKTAERIAGDIRRRYLPAYLPLYAKCCDVAERRRAHNSAQEQTRERLRQITSSAYSSQYKPHDIHDNGPRAWNAEVSGPTVYRLTLDDLSVDDAETLIRAFLATTAPERNY